MDLIQTISAVGIGAISIKILDIIWLQRALRISEKNKWLREKRLKAYTELTKEILTFGFNSEAGEDIFNGLSVATEAILLVDDKLLATEIQSLISNLSSVYSDSINLEKTDENTKKIKERYKKLYIKGNEIITKLRISLHEI